MAEIRQKKKKKGKLQIHYSLLCCWEVGCGWEGLGAAVIYALPSLQKFTLST